MILHAQFHCTQFTSNSILPVIGHGKPLRSYPNTWTPRNSYLHLVYEGSKQAPEHQPPRSKYRHVTLNGSTVYMSSMNLQRKPLLISLFMTIQMNTMRLAAQNCLTYTKTSEIRRLWWSNHLIFCDSPSSTNLVESCAISIKSFFFLNKKVLWTPFQQ